MSITLATNDPRMAASLEHLCAYGLSEKQLAYALDKTDQSLRTQRTRHSKPAKHRRELLPPSFLIRVMRWTLIDDVEDQYRAIVELAGGRYDPDTESKEQWMERFRQAHQALKSLGSKR